MIINERQEECAVAVKVDGRIADELMLSCFETGNPTFFRPSLSVEQPFIFAKLDPKGMASVITSDVANLGLMCR